MNAKILVVIFSILALAVILFIQNLIMKKRISLLLHIVSLLLQFFLLVVAAFLIMVGSPVLWRFHFPIFGIYIALFANICGDIFYSVYNAIRKKKQKSLCGFKVWVLGACIFGILFTTYGMINMSMVIPEYHNYISDKVNKTHKFVFLSDVHSEAAQNFDTLRQVVEKINTENPEFVVLGGDITDDFSTKADMEKTYEIIGKITSPIYYVYGNHDRQGNSRFAHGRQYSEDELRDTICENGIIILQDEFVEFDDDLTFLGREDCESDVEYKAADELIFDNYNQYTIVFVHNPYDEEYIKTIHPNLQVCGHAHVGQFWPLATVYELTGYEAYGAYEKDSTLLYVSSGLAGWKIPFRNEGHCHYDVFTIQPTK